MYGHLRASVTTCLRRLPTATEVSVPYTCSATSPNGHFLWIGLVGFTQCIEHGEYEQIFTSTNNNFPSHVLKWVARQGRLQICLHEAMGCTSPHLWENLLLPQKCLHSKLYIMQTDAPRLSINIKTWVAIQILILLWWLKHTFYVHWFAGQLYTFSVLIQI